MKQAYRERQKFNQWWLFLIIFGILGLALWGVIQQLVFDIPFGNNPAPDLVLIGFLLVAILLCYLLFTTTLTTKIDTDNALIKFGFLKKEIPMDRIKSVEVIDYGFVGGWGYRISKEYGTIYSVSGSKGLYFVLKNGQKFVAGTQNGKELKQFIAAHINNLK